MKTLLLALTAMLHCAAAYPQPYIGLPESGGKWVNSHYNLVWQNPNPIPFYELAATVSYCTAGNDTLINALTYYAIDTCGGGYKGALRNWEGKVFYIPKDSAGEYLLYDYSLLPGDTAYNVYSEDFFGFPFLEPFMVCTSVDQIMIDGAPRKVIYHQLASHWIEGVGQDRGLLLEPWENISNYSNDLHCMSLDDMVVYPELFEGLCQLTLGTGAATPGGLAFRVYPNPARQHFRIEQPEGMEPLQRVDLCDTQGRLLRSWPAHQGLYVTEGLPAGMYVARASGREGVYTQKLVIEP